MKTCLIILLLCTQFFSYAIDTSKYDILDDKNFEELYSNKIKCQSGDDDKKRLREQPSISQYKFTCEADKVLYAEYAKRRIKSKKYTTYLNMTDTDVIHLQSDKNFLNLFSEYLRLNNETDYYSWLATLAVDISRAPVEEGCILGKPLIDEDIRRQNTEYIKVLDLKRMAMYHQLDEHMDLKSRNHDEKKFKFNMEKFLNFKTLL